MKSPIDVLRSYRPHNGTLHDAFSSRCQSRKDDVFIIQSEASLTWAQFGARYDRLARALKVLGIGRGDRVAVVGRNHTAHLLALFAWLAWGRSWCRSIRITVRANWPMLWAMPTSKASCSGRSSAID